MGVKNAGLGNVGPNCMGGNRRTGKCRTKFRRGRKAGPPSMEHEMYKYKCKSAIQENIVEQRAIYIIHNMERHSSTHSSIS